MSIDQRKHIRFSLDIPCTLINKFGEPQETLLQQISIGGCFTEWEENVYPGDEFRLEIPMLNRNKIPLRCKAIYRFEDTGIGVKFIDISRFEQDLVAGVITDRLANEGLPVNVSPFAAPAMVASEGTARSQPVTPRDTREAILEEIMSGEHPS
ncbi:MAG: PilZ domain-containing protein [Acidobacteriota bacterium]